MSIAAALPAAYVRSSSRWPKPPMSTSAGLEWWGLESRKQRSVPRKPEEMDADILNTLVTSAIWRAQQLEDRGIGSAALAWAEVSQLEEQLASVFPLSEAEGRIARRGSVRAAIKAGEHSRARALADRFSVEADAPKALKAELRKMLREEAGAVSRRYPYAAKRHRLDEARLLAARLRAAGPFGLAA